MRKIALVVAVLFAFPAMALDWMPAGLSGLKARVSGFVNAREFGASCTGSGDDAPAIQAAIDAFGTNGGPVYLPAGKCMLGSRLNAKINTSLIGAGGGQWTVGQTTTLLDATAITNSTAILFPSTSRSITLRDFALIGPFSTSNTGSVGIDLGANPQQPVLQNITVYGFHRGIDLHGASHALVLNCQCQSQKYVGLDITGNDIHVLGGLYANDLGWTPDAANIRVGNGAAYIDISAEVDEGFSVSSASIAVLGASFVTIHDMHVYYTHVDTTGMGITLGNGTNNPTNCTLQNVKVERYGAGPAPAAGIRLYGSGHVLTNVISDVAADGGTAGTAIVDNATGTKEFAVTRITSGGTVYTSVRDPSMPTSSPGAGTKQIYADSADSYRLKLAN